MTFDEIESAWALQQPSKAGAVDLPALRRALKSQLNRRRRLLVVGACSLGFSLIVMTPERGAAPKISAPAAGLPRPTVEVMDPLRYRIKFPSLEPRQYSYRLTF